MYRYTFYDATKGENICRKTEKKQVLNQLIKCWTIGKKGRKKRWKWKRKKSNERTSERRPIRESLRRPYSVAPLLHSRLNIIRRNVVYIYAFKIDAYRR